MDILTWEKINEAFIEKKALIQSSAITVGSFDGVHKGHQFLLDKVLLYEKAFSKGVVTFTRPTRLKKTKNYSGDILTLRLKLKKLEVLGFDFVILIDFSSDFAKMNGIEFFEILVKTIHMKALFVGKDFSCGFRHSTDVKAIAEIAKKYDFDFDSIERLCLKGTDISSSAIRAAIKRADFDTAKSLLGSSFLLDIFNIGFAHCSENCFTAKKKNFKQIIPKEGSYAVELYLLNGIKTRAVFSIIGEDVFLELDKNESGKDFYEIDLSTLVKSFDYLVFV